MKTIRGQRMTMSLMRIYKVFVVVILVGFAGIIL